MDVEYDQKVVADLMMSNVKEFGKYSFELEEKREQSLINQSAQMLTAFSVFSIAIYTVLPVLKEIPGLSFSKLLFCVGVVSTILVASLVLAMLVQWRYKYSTMQNVEEFFKSVNEEPQNYSMQAQFDIQWKEQLMQIHISKKDLNDKRARLIKASMILFFIAVAAMLLSAAALIFIYI